MGVKQGRFVILRFPPCFEQCFGVPSGTQILGKTATFKRRCHYLCAPDAVKLKGLENSVDILAGKARE